MSSSKSLEAEKALKEAKRRVKTSLFRWSPDWLGAAMHYTNAAKLFKLAGNVKAAVEAYESAAEANYQVNTPYSAGTMMMESGKLQSGTKASTAFEYASRYFVEAEKWDTAASALRSAAEAVESEDPPRALTILLKACDLMEAGDRHVFAFPVFFDTLQWYARHQQWSDGIALLSRMVRDAVRENVVNEDEGLKIT